MITIHEAKAADFTTLGLGALLPSECTVRERAGGMYELKIVHPITDDGRHHRIKPMRIIKAPAPVRETPLVEIDQAGTIYRDIYKVVTDGRRLYLRVEPDSGSKGLHTYRPGTEVVSLELSADGKWRRVIILNGGATGWMWAGNLEYVRTETENIVGDTPGGIVQPRQTREQLFRVYFYSPDTKTRTITAEARHITYDLAGAVVDGKYNPENVPANQVCAQIMARADHDVSDFHIYCTITDPISGEYGGRNILDCLLDPETGIVAQTKARIVRDNYDIFILPDEVRSRGVELRYGKNLLSAYMDTDTSNTITRIKPVGKDKDGEPLYIEDNGGWVESPYINDYPVVYSKEVEYDVVESDDLPINQARALLKEKAEADFAAGCDMAAVKLDADFVRLELTDDYKHLANQYALHLYDSVPVIDREADIVATARMTEYVYDAILDEYQDTGLGALDEVKSTIYGYELASGTVSGGKLIPNTVNGDRLQNLSVSYGKFDLAAIKQLSADAITAIRANIRELVAGNITTDQLYADLAEIAAAQITAANIEKANIQWAEIENLSAEIAKVVKAEVENLEVDWAGIYEADIEWANITNLTAEIAKITAAEIGKAKINWAQIVDVKIGTADIEDASINTAKIALGAITSALIKAGAIGTAQIADGSITSAKIVELSADVIKSGTLSTDRLLIKGAGGLFYEINATAGGLTSAQLTEEQYKNAISGTALVARSVTADKIAAKSITANEILSGTITAAEINVANLFAADATIAALDNYILRTQTIEAIEGKLDVWASDKIRLAVDDVQIGGRNYILGTAEPYTAVGTGSRQWLYPWKCASIAANRSLYGKTVTISFDYEVAITSGSFNVGINDLWIGVKTFNSSTPSGHLTLTREYAEFNTGSDVFIYIDGTWTGSVTFSKVKVEIGSKETDWTPAPEDADAAIAELSAAISIQADEITSNAQKIETVSQAAGNAQNAANAAQNTANAAQNAANSAQGTANGAATRVTSAEQRISAAESAITSKVSKTEFDALGNTVLQMGTEIRQNEEEILLLAGKKSGGTQLLKNGGFYGGLSNWLKMEYNVNGEWRNLYVDPVSPNDYRANEVPNLVLHAQYETGMFGAAQVVNGLRKNTQYTISGYVASHRCNRAGIEIRDTTASRWAMNPVFDVGWGGTNLSAYNRFEYTFDTGDYSDYQITLYSNNFGENAYVWWAQVKLEEGNTATAWSPHPDDPASGVNAGGVVRVDQTGVHMSGGTIEMETSDGDEYIHIRNDGISASSLSAPDVTPRYGGPGMLYVNPNATSEQIAKGDTFRSLADALAKLSGRWVGYNVTINLAAGMTEYGSLSLVGVSGGWWITIQGNSSNPAKLVGGLYAYHGSSPVSVKYLNVDATGGRGIHAEGSGQMVQVSNCVITGNGNAGTYGICSYRGACVEVENCEVYDFARSLYGHNCGLLTGYNCKGNNQVGANHSTIYLRGTMPCDSPTWAYAASWAGQVIATSITVDQGSKPTPIPAPTTAVYDLLHADSYAAGNVNSWVYPEGKPNDDIYQGYTGQAGRICGCMWFDNAAIRNALSGKTIKQASIRLTAQRYVGYGREVTVYLRGTATSYSGRSGQPALTTDYGIIGTAEPAVTGTFTIPAQAISDIASGRIEGLVLYHQDTADMQGKNYSRNYMRFDGSTSGNAETRPRLTVVYQ